MFKVYSTPTCPECVRLKKFLSDMGISFEEVNVFENKDAADFIVKSTGMRRVPVFQSDDKMIVGFNQNEIEKMLNNRR